MFRGRQAQLKSGKPLSPLLSMLPSTLIALLMRHQPPEQEVRVAIGGLCFFLQYVIRKWKEV